MTMSSFWEHHACPPFLEKLSVARMRRIVHMASVILARACMTDGKMITG